MGGSAPKTPTYALSHSEASGIASLCPPLFAPHYVAWKASRCRRFIGDTHGSRVFVSQMVAHRANQITGAFERFRRSNPHLANRNAKLVKSKASSLLFLRFRSLRNFTFFDFAFLIFSIRLM